MGFRSRIQVLGELVRFQERAKEQNAMKYAKLKRAWDVMMLGGLRLCLRTGVHDTQFLVILVGKMIFPLLGDLISDKPRFFRFSNDSNVFFPFLIGLSVAVGWKKPEGTTM